MGDQWRRTPPCYMLGRAWWTSSRQPQTQPRIHGSPRWTSPSSTKPHIFAPYELGTGAGWRPCRIEPLLTCSTWLRFSKLDTVRWDHRACCPPHTSDPFRHVRRSRFRLSSRSVHCCNMTRSRRTTSCYPVTASSGCSVPSRRLPRFTNRRSSCRFLFVCVTTDPILFTRHRPMVTGCSSEPYRLRCKCIIAV